MNRRFLFTIGLLLLALSASAKRVGAYCYFANDGSQLYEDVNVKVALEMENKNLILVIYNKTTNSIYVDKANSFVYNNDEVVGSLNSGAPTPDQEQSALVIAPESRKVLCTWKNLETMFMASLVEDKVTDKKRGRFINPETGFQEKFEAGLNRSYTKGQTPFTVRGVINYSTEQGFRIATKVTVSNYITDIVIDGYKGVKDSSFQLPYCQQLKGKRADYAFVSGVEWTGTWGGLVGLIVGVEAVVIGSIFITFAANGLL